MTEDEVRAFLTEGTRTAKLATVREDGRPHVAPIWFVLDEEHDDDIVFTTWATSAKGRNLRRDHRVSLCVDDQTPPYSHVVIEGTVELSIDPDEMLLWATRIGERYMGEDRAAEFGLRNAVVGEMLVRVHRTKVVAEKDVCA